MNVGQVESTGIHPCHLLCTWRERKGGRGSEAKRLMVCVALSQEKVKLFSILCTKEENNLSGGGGGYMDTSIDKCIYTYK